MICWDMHCMKRRLELGIPLIWHFDLDLILGPRAWEKKIWIMMALYTHAHALDLL